MNLVESLTSEILAPLHPLYHMMLATKQTFYDPHNYFTSLNFIFLFSFETATRNGAR